ncbi:MAG: ABC transporter permease [Nitrospirae bacterium]|nr:MAG: ABC transporter permease [Nitrospirota bacterium]
MGLTAKATAGVIALLFVLSLIAPLIIPYGADMIDLDSIKEPPGWEHPFGTDNKGRDILARVLAGGKISIGISVAAVIISLGIGLVVGLVSGYFGGVPDMILMSVVDLILAFPSLILAIGISLLLPPGLYTVIIAITLVGWTSFARLIRGYVLSIRESSYVEAARSIGCSNTRILLVHILPQCIPLSLVMAGMKLGGYILTEAALSFLGLGVQPPTATWGSMISSSRAFLNTAPWMVLAPGICIAVTALCFNLMGDSLKDRYDVMKTGASGQDAV